MQITAAGWAIIFVLFAAITFLLSFRQVAEFWKVELRFLAGLMTMFFVLFFLSHIYNIPVANMPFQPKLTNSMFK